MGGLWGCFTPINMELFHPTYSGPPYIKKLFQ